MMKRYRLYWDVDTFKLDQTAIIETNAGRRTFMYTIKKIEKIEDYCVDDVLDELKKRGYKARIMEVDENFYF